MIFYFSGTGNSRFAAMKLASLTGDKAYSIADIFGGDSFKKEGLPNVTGFVFPVYYFGLPEMVKRFAVLPGLRDLLGSYVYCVITCGANPAAADAALAKALGREINYSASLVMPDNYVIAYNPSGPEKAKAALKEADSKLEIISRDINRRKQSFTKKISKTLASKALYPFYNLFRTTLFYYADDNCVGCGLCERLCPDKAIEIKGGKPDWMKYKCQHCTACINACPQKAIQFTALTKKRGRYYILNLNKNKNEPRESNDN
ncbi:MAG: EFR1 family ferrodoxin [Clostridiales bacterium]|nr:EFR1 family ferrodoxin [Clostridiales bacterium]